MLSSQSILRRPVVYVFVAIAVVLCLAKLSYSLGPRPWKSHLATAAAFNFNRKLLKQKQEEELVKPTNVNITGMVFFGRRGRVQSMNCYVERNLVDNGGWLDEVLWYANTDNAEDLKYLDQIIERSPRYKKISLEKPVQWPEYTKLWRNLERGTIYVKLDDDILWLADDAIPHMVTTKLKYPDSFAVSANVINGPPLSFIHFHLGALHPYLPELEGDPTYNNHSEFENWRPSSHPFWSGPSDFEWPPTYDPPSGRTHRWLRVENDKALHRTPAAKLEYAFWGTSYESWSIAAQQHYSFLENLERDTTNLYKFQPPWNMQGERIRINCLAILGDDILDTDVENWPDDRGDEDMIVLELPEKLQRHVLVEGKALAAHYSYMAQGGLDSTDLLSRYTSYAHENICKH
ncbi:hypothetical protein ACJ72_06750 [Emergomyces africanus]|uniref:Uncharacterized protein n=1 Tax=Emergomyces africanus TaxID=1955775 RepID=A0A1B7NQJ2_9EURO|nr:hypothetical protein ACJ72_06750 [Emergomyces africanus]